MTRTIVPLLLGLFLLAGRSPGKDGDDVAGLKREIALLKKENDLLTRENALLKKENEQLKGGGPAAEAKKAAAKTTLDGVEYEFVGIRRNGKQATLTVAATSQRGTKNLIRMLRLKLTTTGGAVYQSPGGTSGGKTPAMGRLVEGVRQLVEFDLGELPTDMTEFSTIMIPGLDDGGMRKALQNPVLLKGKFTTEN